MPPSKTVPLLPWRSPLWRGGGLALAPELGAVVAAEGDQGALPQAMPVEGLQDAPHPGVHPPVHAVDGAHRGVKRPVLANGCTSSSGHCRGTWGAL